MNTFLYISGIILIMVSAAVVAMGFKTTLVLFGVLLLVVAYFIHVILPGKVEEWKDAKKSKKLDEKGE